jgi:ATP-dependent helicase HrpA
MFIEHALVRGEYRTRGAFQAKNKARLAEVERLRDKARRSDMMADESALLNVFDRRLPETVVNGKTFEAWREAAEAENPDILVLSLDDVLAGDPGLSPSDYPDVVKVHGAELPVTYRFEPGAEDDGMTLSVPLVLLPQLEAGELEWTIPGWHRDKIAALLHELPRSTRRDLGSIPELSATLAARLSPFKGAMVPALAAAIAEECGIDVPEEAFHPNAVADYLRPMCRIVGPDGQVVAQSKDLQSLWKQQGGRAREAWKASAPASSWERKNVAAWDFGPIEPFVVRRVGGAEVRAYPALVDRGSSVDLVHLESSAAALTATRGGVRRLIVIAARGAVSALAPRIPRALPRSSGATPSRAEQEAFAAVVVDRIVDDAFGLTEDRPPPRSKTEFESVLGEGSPRLPASYRRFADAIARASAELEATLKALRSAEKHPGAKLAIAEINGHLELLAPPDLLAWVPLVRLEHFPRYLRGVQARLGRAIADPRRDREKLAPISPLWAAFAAKQATARDRQAASDLRWAFEELRVAIFAPELKTASPVSVARLTAEVAALR